MVVTVFRYNTNMLKSDIFVSSDAIEWKNNSQLYLLVPTRRWKQPLDQLQLKGIYNSLIVLPTPVASKVWLPFIAPSFLPKKKFFVLSKLKIAITITVMCDFMICDCCRLFDLHLILLLSMSQQSTICDSKNFCNLQSLDIWDSAILCHFSDFFICIIS